jgi:hypothetical protein
MESGSKEEGSGSEADDKEQLSPVAVMDFPFHDDDDNDDAVEDGGTSDGGSACSPSPFGDSLAQLHQSKCAGRTHWTSNDGREKARSNFRFNRP